MISSDRRYRLEADGDRVWAALGDVERYQDWWPWLRVFEGRGLDSGDLWTCEIQPPLPFSIRFTVELLEVEAPRRVRAAIAGDVRGWGLIELADSGAGCDLKVRSELWPSNRVVAAFVRVARPIAQVGHAWVFDTAVAQFADRAL